MSARRALLVVTVVALTASSAAAQYYEERICNGDECRVGCEIYTLAQYTCYQTTTGGSGNAYCDVNGNLKQIVYPLSVNCSGYAVEQTVATDQCFAASSGGYVEFSCSFSNKHQPRAGNILVLPSPYVTPEPPMTKATPPKLHLAKLNGHAVLKVSGSNPAARVDVRHAGSPRAGHRWHRVVGGALNVTELKRDLALTKSPRFVVRQTQDGNEAQLPFRF